MAQANLDVSPVVNKPPRLLSLDALRGFDMLWIIGAEAIVSQLAKWPGGSWLDAWSQQLRHVAWDGLRAYDLIFPLFMFLSGVAIPFSFDSRLAAGATPRRMWQKVAIRVCLLVFLGMVYNGLLSDQAGTPRLASVLGQIGIAWGMAAAVYLLVKDIRYRIGAVGVIIGLVVFLQLVVPVPEHGAGVLTSKGSINAWIDQMLLPGKLLGGAFDPEGLLCIFSAGAVTLSGTCLGCFLRKYSPSWKFAGWQAAAGVAVIAAGALCWTLGYPPIKKMWTGTFDLLVIGISLLLFAFFYAIIDVLRWQKWSFPLRVIGMNALTIYLLVRFINFKPAATLLFGRLGNALGDAKSLVIVCGVLLLEWLLLYYLYRKKIFLKV
jgi:predicted acyltransferase